MGAEALYSPLCPRLEARHPQGSCSHRIDSPAFALPECKQADERRCNRELVLTPGGEDQPPKWRTRGTTIPPGASADTEVPPLPSLWCPHHLQALRDSHLQVKEGLGPPSLRPAHGDLQEPFCKGWAPHEGRGRGTTRGGVRQHEGARPC